MRCLSVFVIFLAFITAKAASLKELSNERGSSDDVRNASHEVDRKGYGDEPNNEAPGDAVAAAINAYYDTYRQAALNKYVSRDSSNVADQDETVSRAASNVADQAETDEAARIAYFQAFQNHYYQQHYSHWSHINRNNEQALEDSDVSQRDAISERNEESKTGEESIEDSISKHGDDPEDGVSKHGVDPEDVVSKHGDDPEDVVSKERDAREEDAVPKNADVSNENDKPVGTAARASTAEVKAAHNSDEPETRAEAAQRASDAHADDEIEARNEHAAALEAGQDYAERTVLDQQENDDDSE